MNNNDSRINLKNKLLKEGLEIKIEKPVRTILDLNFGKEKSANTHFDKKWITADLSFTDEGFIIKKNLIRFEDIKFIDLIKPQLFFEGYVELTDYYDNYLKIRVSNQFLDDFYSILDERVK